MTKDNTYESEEYLITEYQNGNGEAGEKLLKVHNNFIWLCIRKTQHTHSLTEEDLYALAIEKFLLAARKFDYSQHNTFLTYAGTLMRRELWKNAKYRINNEKNFRLCTNLVETREERNCTEIEYDELLEKIDEIESVKIRNVLHEKLKGGTFESISKARGVTREASRILYLRGLSILKEKYNVE